MAPGKIVRRILGPRLFKIVGKAYRSIFVDLQKVADCSATVFAENAHVLDIGGGDGEPLNYLLRVRQDLRVSMIDLSESVGSFVDDSLRSRVSIFPHTSMREFFETADSRIDGVMISDVVHHIRVEHREEFFLDLRAMLLERGLVPIVIKDIEPDGFIAWLAKVTDWYITGDRSVSQISKSELTALLMRTFPGARVEETPLFETNKPNYSLVVTG